METALLVGAIIIGAAACPLIAVVQRRRGRAGCCPPSRTRVSGAGESLAELKAARERLEGRIGVLEREACTGGRAVLMASTRRS